MWWKEILNFLKEYWVALVGVVVCLSLAVPMAQELKYKYRQKIFARMTQGMLVLIFTAVLYIFYILITSLI